MPSSESEVAERGALMEAVKALPTPPDVAGKTPARINAKRKPDKSKIFRIRTSDPSDSLICPHCRAEFLNREHMEDHMVICGREPPVLQVPTACDNLNTHSDVLRRNQDVANNNQAHLLKLRTTNSSSPDSREASIEPNNGYNSDSNMGDFGPLAQLRSVLQNNAPQIPIAQQLAQSNMALEAIQNTRMALAQLASSAINASTSNPQAMQDLVMLQGTLYTLHQQQMMQVQLIQQLQAQLSIKNKDSSQDDKSYEPESTNDQDSNDQDRSQSPCPPTSLANNDENGQTMVTSSFISSLMERFKPHKNESPKEKSPSSTPVGLPANNIADVRERPLSPPMTASSIASAVIQHTDPPPTDEPNTLEMLQRTANQVLNNASQGLLTNRLIDDYNKPSDGKDPYYKHRCRYCGKVFGSDSALQIHVRSHTGERPFKCNICGNRFTTKGNLKVHFQRHSARFPHVKMNPHPVPEHLDKFHPPLLAQLGELKDYPPAPTGPPNPFSSSPIAPPIPPLRIPGPPTPLDIHNPFTPLDLFRRSQECKKEPENLSSNQSDYPNSPEHIDEDDRVESNMDVDDSSASKLPDNESSNMSLENELKNDTLKRESEESFEHEENDLRDPYRECNDIIKGANEFQREKNELILKRTDQFVDHLEGLKEYHNRIRELHDKNKHKNQEIERMREDRNSERDDEGPLDIRIRHDNDLKGLNESSAEDKEESDMDNGNSMSNDQPADLRIGPELKSLGMPPLPFPGPRLPLNFPFLPGLSPPFPVSVPSSTPSGISSALDPSKDPNIYTNLLPRPGSNDNSWEALIEIQKTSETMKLEQLVNNIEHKLSDPNQCIICHRVLSCKSALQMHYRTHTGERPFKCKICGRAFTTKGNLKTHMGVHRAKPPMRMLHQCPVCHKKFTNALVLQQHIRLHTGEPTDLSPEQIAAAEVKDFHPHLHGHPVFPNLLPTGFHLPPHHLQNFPPLPLGMRPQLSPEALKRMEMNEQEDRLPRTDEEDKYLRLFSNSSRSSSTGSVEQRTAEDLSMRLRDDTVNGVPSPHRSISPTTSDYSDAGDHQEESYMGPRTSPGDRVISRSVSPAVSIESQESPLMSISGPLDLASRPPPPFFSPFGIFPPPLVSSTMSPGTPGIPGINPLYVPNTPGRGHTTCQVCFKTFACQSALEIHYRSHTKERPYKCTLCDRGFSTKCKCRRKETRNSVLLQQGNMKQHMLTHKIRDGNSLDQSSSKDKPLTSRDEEPASAGSAPSSSSHVYTASNTSTSIPLPASIASPLISASVSALISSTREDDKIDSGLKRERDGEIQLPIPKKLSGTGEDAEIDPVQLLRRSRTPILPIEGGLASFIGSTPVGAVSSVASPRS